MISDFCRKRVAPYLLPVHTEALRKFLIASVDTGVGVPRYAGKYDWTAMGMLTNVPAEMLVGAGRHITPLLDAIGRSVARAPKPAEIKTQTTVRPPPVKKDVAPRRTLDVTDRANRVLSGVVQPKPAPVPPAPARPKRQYTRRPIVEFPKPLWTEWEDVDGFADALNLHIRRHGDSVRHLFHAVAKEDKATNHRTLMKWATGELTPRSIQSLEVLGRIERRYRLPPGYFKAKLPYLGRARTGHVLEDFTPAERRRLAWHLPDDFNARSPAEQDEILDWVNRVIISGSTDYRAFQAAAIKNRYAVRFRAFQGKGLPKKQPAATADVDQEMVSSVVDAPAELEREMAGLLKFKTATLTAFGFQRNGVWGEETASQKVEHLGLMFGAITAPADGPVHGFGAPLESLCFAMLVFPPVWDWYLQWREQRRGFFTKWEVGMLALLTSVVKVDTGWIRQTPALADRLRPIDVLITAADIARVRADWHGACDEMYRHARQRLKEIERVAKVHRDPFEPILPILEADSPVGEYRKITEEILRFMPDERLYPRPAAEAVRSFLMLRIGLHTGLRQKNLRELRICPPGRMPTSERNLEDMKCGELRWSSRDHGWEILIPSVAFKNANSSFFGQKPFRLVLPDMAGLYEMIDAYVDRHRARLLASADDPGTFFVKTVKQSSTNARYDQTTFYDAWRLIIQRYGIYNPYTERGAIKGLLPHGPHNVRDVLATHILKKTGSYEQASYAIQDTPDMVQQHYGRFLPQDKAAIAAQVLNRVWDE
ncbi:MAG: hypothetical protein J0I99_15140 [Devosia sp.]|uniref:hypothetical protein n=1 Tax=Devosia sp. TaxID=1871048 RepID=UPI001AC8CA81|nr:hypothetical protein [Devosia sp.]MBN9317076.1 hypothetical protein [Devosia sp.]